MHYFSQRLADSVWIEPFNQGNDRLEADAGLRALFIQRRISHDGTHHTLREHLSNADSRMDETGHKLRLVKRSAHLKIDAAVALSMACSRALSLNLY
jgi:phage terminase large subunit-like protein